MLKKYSGIISIIAVVGAVLLAIGGIATAIILKSFLPVLYVGICTVAFYLFMHSYALLLETTAKNEQTLDSIKQSMQKLEELVASKQPTSWVRVDAAKAVGVAQSRMSTTKATDTPTSSTVPAVTNDRIVCPKCGREQPASRRRCFDCGTEFTKEKIDEEEVGKSSRKDKITCPQCGTVQRSNRKVCLNCGKQLDP